MFAGIFVCIVPVIAMLGAASEARWRPGRAWSPRRRQPINVAYFWLTGGLSSFLDNAPPIWCSSSWPAAMPSI